MGISVGWNCSQFSLQRGVTSPKGWEQLPWRFRASTEAHWTVWCVDALNYISCFMFHCWCCLMPNSLWAHGNIHNHLSKSGIRKGWVVSTTPAVSDHPLLCIAELKICWQHASCPLSQSLFLSSTHQLLFPAHCPSISPSSVLLFHSYCYFRFHFSPDLPRLYRDVWW